MELQGFVENEGVLDSAQLSIDVWKRLGALLAEEPSIEELLDELPPAVWQLPSRTLRPLIETGLRHHRWEQQLSSLQDQRASAGDPLLPERAIRMAMGPTGLETLRRAARTLTPDAYADENRWGAALEAALDVWERALALALSEGALRPTLIEDHAAAAEYADLAQGRQTLDDLPPHRWLALSRAARQGAARLEWELPVDAIREQWALRESALAPWPVERNSDSVLAELVIDPLPVAISRTLEDKASREVIEAAASTYETLLTVPPPDTPRVAGLWISQRPALGLALVDRAGEVRGTARIGFTKGWKTRLVAWLDGEGVKHVALPTQGPEPERLTEVRRVVAKGRQVHTIRTAAISEARGALMKGRTISGEAGHAAVLAARAANPLEAWGAVDPVGLGLVEYQADLDETAIRATLTLARALIQKRGVGPAAGKAGAARPAVIPGNLNPLVKKLEDLRPGMLVNGVVTNIARFGAFVNFGLSQEGLVHISDLADEFVANPNDVVRVGQSVQARVKAVDFERRRISLSLRADSPPRRPGGPPSGPGTSSAPRPRRDGDTSSRAKALRALDKLFDR